jgi:regulator of ribosome biosynthesis
MLPEPKLPLPRYRKLPEPKVLSRWEQFAKAKGLKKTKKDKKVYDEVLDKWVPTYGYQHNKAIKEKDWLLEVPKNVDPMTDMFQEKRDLRQEKIAKNEINRMKNVARASKIKLPRAGFVGEASATSKDLLTAVSIAKNSTASVGKFQDKLPKEKPARGLGVKELLPGSAKRKRLLDPAGEKNKNLELVESILNKRPKFDIDKAVTLQKRENRHAKMAEAEEGDNEARSGPKKKGGKGKGKNRDGKGKKGQKPKGSHGVRSVVKRKTFGRKRR